MDQGLVSGDICKNLARNSRTLNSQILPLQMGKLAAMDSRLTTQTCMVCLVGEIGLGRRGTKSTRGDVRALWVVRHAWLSTCLDVGLARMQCE